MLRSGHKTLIEHITFNLAFINVSAYVEQFMLEFRLASFTVKSRRYVDFSKMGFVIPSFVDANGKSLSNAEELQKFYNEHMTFLFKEYGEFIKADMSAGVISQLSVSRKKMQDFYCHILIEAIFIVL